MEKYQFRCKVGSGAFGQVWRCTNTITRSDCAVKRLECCSPLDTAQALWELCILQLCSHPHVAQLREAYRGVRTGHTYVVLELTDRPLTRELLHHPRGLPEDRVKLIAYQLLAALDHLHRQQVVHRDLKPANVLLSGTATVKLCDFGSSACTPLEAACPELATAALHHQMQQRQMQQQHLGRSAQLLASGCGSRWYSAPEALLGEAPTPAMDMWSLGCIIAELALGRPLFPSEDAVDQLRHMVRVCGPLGVVQQAALHARLCPAQCARVEEFVGAEPAVNSLPLSIELRQLLCSVLAPDPSKRFSAAQALQLPYFTSLTAAGAFMPTILGGHGPSVGAGPVPASLMAGPAPGIIALAAQASSQHGFFSAGGLVKGASSSPAGASGGLGSSSGTPRRVSALTARLRAQRGAACPWEHDGGHIDLMPQVHALLASYHAAGTDANLPLVSMPQRPSTPTHSVAVPRQPQQPCHAGNVSVSLSPVASQGLGRGVLPTSACKGRHAAHHQRSRSHSRLQHMTLPDDIAALSPAKRMALTPMTPYNLSAGLLLSSPLTTWSAATGAGAATLAAYGSCSEQRPSPAGTLNGEVATQASNGAHDEVAFPQPQIGSLTSHMAAVGLGVQLEVGSLGSDTTSADMDISTSHTIADVRAGSWPEAAASSLMAASTPDAPSQTTGSCLADTLATCLPVLDSTRAVGSAPSWLAMAGAAAGSDLLLPVPASAGKRMRGDTTDGSFPVAAQPKQLGFLDSPSPSTNHTPVSGGSQQLGVAESNTGTSSLMAVFGASLPQPILSSGVAAPRGSAGRRNRSSGRYAHLSSPSSHSSVQSD